MQSADRRTGDQVMDEYCRKCGKELTHDEIALYKKIYNRGAKDFLCISCSSQYLQVSEELLLTKMQEFKDTGCTLFSSSSISEGLA